MIKVYFEIFGTKLVKQLDEKKYESMPDDQIEYFIRGALKVHKIEKLIPKNEVPNYIKDLFGSFNNLH